MDQKPDLDPPSQAQSWVPPEPPESVELQNVRNLASAVLARHDFLHEKMIEKDDGIPIQNPSQNDGAHRCPDSGYGRLHDRDIVATARCVFSPRVADAPELPAKEIV